MTPQTALAFIKKLNADNDLLNHVSSFKGVDALLQLAAESGYSFTVDEWRQALSSMESGELSEDELGKVAGGGGTDRFKFQGVDGESTDDKHKGWIEIASYSFG
jgi:predicted ribosomally synthesized peptide with nif11-like leader